MHHSGMNVPREGGGVLPPLSFPANGSRERAPDDRLRRGIQYAAACRLKH